MIKLGACAPDLSGGAHWASQMAMGDDPNDALAAIRQASSQHGHDVSVPEKGHQTARCLTSSGHWGLCEK